jgi:hypothetical protein
MPQCHRCRRVQPTAEVRRTKLGWLCKDNWRGSRCWAIARAIKQAERVRRREERAAACRVAAPAQRKGTAS